MSVTVPRSMASLATAGADDCPTMSNKSDAASLLTSPRDVLLRSKSTTYTGEALIANVVTFDKINSWISGSTTI